MIQIKTGVPVNISNKYYYTDAIDRYYAFGV